MPRPGEAATAARHEVRAAADPSDRRRSRSPTVVPEPVVDAGDAAGPRSPSLHGRAGVRWRSSLIVAGSARRRSPRRRRSGAGGAAIPIRIASSSSDLWARALGAVEATGFRVDPTHADRAGPSGGAAPAGGRPAAQVAGRADARRPVRAGPGVAESRGPRSPASRAAPLGPPGRAHRHRLDDGRRPRSGATSPSGGTASAVQSGSLSAPSRPAVPTGRSLLGDSWRLRRRAPPSQALIGSVPRRSRASSRISRSRATAMASTTRKPPNASQKLTDSTEHRQHDRRPGGRRSGAPAGDERPGSRVSRTSGPARDVARSGAGSAVRARRAASLTSSHYFAASLNALELRGSVTVRRHRRRRGSWPSSGPHCWAARAHQPHRSGDRPARPPRCSPDRSRRRRTARARRPRRGSAVAPATRRRLAGRRRPRAGRGSAARPPRRSRDAARPEQPHTGGAGRPRRGAAPSAATIAGAVSTAPSTVSPRVIVVNPPTRTLTVNVRAADALAAQPGGHGVGQAHQLAPQLGAVVEVVGERLLVADRLQLPVGLDRPIVAPGGQVEEVPAVGPPERADDDGSRSRRGEVADGLHPHPGQALAASPGRRPTAEPPAADAGRPARRPAGPRRRRARARTPVGVGPRLGSTDASLARNLFGRHADRARQRRAAPRSSRAERVGDGRAVAEQRPTRR